MLTKSFAQRGMFVLLLVTASALPSMAQGVGAIAGTVMDDTGAVLPGANVTLSSAVGTVGGSQETTTDGRGAYQFLRLVPGTYTVRAQMQGFRTVEQPNLVVNADVTARADMKLAIGTLEEGIIVSGGSPLLDTTTAVKQTVLTRTGLDALPNRTDVWSIVRVVPGVVINKLDVGGSEAFLQSTTTVRGSTTENKFMIDGMDVSTPTGNGTTAVIYLDRICLRRDHVPGRRGLCREFSGRAHLQHGDPHGDERVPRRGDFQRHHTRPGRVAELLDPSCAHNCFPACLRKRWKPTLTSNPTPTSVLMTGRWRVAVGPILRDRLWFAATWHDQRLDWYNSGATIRTGRRSSMTTGCGPLPPKCRGKRRRTPSSHTSTTIRYELIGHRGGGTFADSRARQYNEKYPVVNQVKFTSVVGSKMAVDLIQQAPVRGPAGSAPRGESGRCCDDGHDDPGQTGWPCSTYNSLDTIGDHD